MNFRSVFSIVCIATASSLLAKLPSLRHMNAFYEEYIGEAISILPGLKEDSRDAKGRFAAQHFLLWDYLDNISNDDLPAHFQSITQLCTQNQMRRFIVFVKDPSRFTFFDPSNTGYNSFVYQANNLYDTVSAVVPDFYISVFFEDDASFSSSAPSGSTPTAPAPSTTFAGYFPAIFDMMNWAKDIISLCPGVKEVAFDPEAHGSNASVEQSLYNYVDNYKYINGMQDIGLGSTIGIDQSAEAYANVSDYPPNSIWTASISTFPTTLPSWRSGNTSPILQSVYIQCYETSIPTMFSAGANSTNANHNGKVAGSILNKILRNQPYLTGQGVISSNRGSSTVTGSGTNFLSFSDPILFVDGTKLGPVDSASSNTTLTLDVGAPFSTTNSPFTRTEIATTWATVGSVTQNMANSIYWMFSLNYTNPFYFFGNWLLDDFMNFAEAFKLTSRSGSTSPFGLNGSSIEFPEHNLVLYNANFLYNVVSGQTTYNGVSINWGVVP